MSDLILYHNAMSTCAAKVRIQLAEKGIPWKGVALDLRAGDAQKADYVKLNPLQVVPTLVDRGQVIIESNVILEYVEDRWNLTPLRPIKPESIAKMRLWMKQLDDGVHAATGAVSMCIAFRRQFLARKPEELRAWLDNMVDPARRERSRAAIEEGMDAPHFAPAVRRFVKLLDEFEEALTQTAWLAGEDYSLADIAYSPYMLRLDHLGFSDLIMSRPKVAEWQSRLFAKRSYAVGVLEWIDPSYIRIFDQERAAARTRINEIAASVPRSKTLALTGGA